VSDDAAVSPSRCGIADPADRRPLRALAVLTGLAVLLPLLAWLGNPALAGPEIRRLAGPDRYSTAVAVSQASFPSGAPAVVLTTGGNFPDALAGGPAAARLRGPVLLTGRDAVPPLVLAELARLRPQRVLLLGGTGAVSGAAADQLLAAGLPVERLAGAGRYETAALVSQTVFPVGVPVAYVATGADYPDALAGAAAAGAAGGPVLLVGRDTLPPATAAELARLKPSSLVVLGGPGAVSTAVERQLASYSPTVRRIAGADRYATAAAVARTAPVPARALFLATGTRIRRRPRGWAGRGRRPGAGAAGPGQLHPR
jgi:putative cell wall-binding protein